MTNRDRCPQTFVDWVLALLEDRFSWLGKETDEQVSGADTVDELATLHQNLIDMRDEQEMGGKKREPTSNPSSSHC